MSVSMLLTFSKNVYKSHYDLILQVAAEEVSLGSYLEQYTRCVEAENSMLLR